METLTQSDIQEYRRIKWRLARDLQLRSETEAGRFIDDVELCFIFGSRSISLPRLHDSTRNGADWWGWKDRLQAKKRTYNGRVVRRKATLISIKLLPSFLALYFADGGFEIYEEEYFYGKLSAHAKKVADFLSEQGPTSVDALRKAVAAPGKAGTRQFHRALFELQCKFKTAVAGLVEKNWGTRVLDLFISWAPHNLLEQAHKLSHEDACLNIATAYLQTAGVATAREMATNFGWRFKDAEQAAAALISSGEAREVRVKGKKGMFLASDEL